MQSKATQTDSNALLRLPAVLSLIPVSRSTWWAWCASGKAPAPIRLGRTTCWRYADIVTFIEQQCRG